MLCLRCKAIKSLGLYFQIKSMELKSVKISLNFVLFEIKKMLTYLCLKSYKKYKMKLINLNFSETIE